MRDAFGTGAEVLVVLALAWVGWTYIRGGTGVALDGLQRANRILVRQVHDLERRVETLEVENAKLRGETNVAEAIMPVIAAVKMHEESAARRSEALLDVLGLMAKQFGTESEQ